MNGPHRPGPTTHRQRMMTWAAICGLFGIVLIAVGVMLFGSRSPSPPSLTKNPRPEIPGEILFRDESQCVAYAPASGGVPVKVSCKDTSPAPIAWIDAQTVAVVRNSDDGPAMYLVAVPTGEERAKELVPEFLERPNALEPVSSKGERARVDSRGRLFISSGGRETEVANFDTQESRLRPVLWSPDGEWLLLYYTPPREFARNELWIVRRNGKDAGLFYHGTAEPYASWRIDGVGITPK